MTKRLQKSVAVLALVLCAAATVAESNTFTFPVYSAARAFHHRRSVSGGKVTAAQPTAGPSTTPAPGGVVVAPVSSPAPAMPVAPAPAPMEPVLSPVTTPAPAPSMLAPAPAGPTPPTPAPATETLIIPHTHAPAPAPMAVIPSSPPTATPASPAPAPATPPPSADGSAPPTSKVTSGAAGLVAYTRAVMLGSAVVAAIVL